MIQIKSKMLFLAACILETIFLLASQIVNSIFLIIPCLVCFLVLVVYAAISGFAIPVILYFLPFSSLLKMRPGTVSFFTIAILLVYAVYLIKGHRRISVYHYIPAILLVALLLIVRTVNGYGIDNSFVFFSVSIFMAPYLASEISEKYDFYWMTVFFVLGITIAAGSSEYLIAFPGVSRYVKLHYTLGAIRHSGYYRDPNFYAAHITTALSGVLVLLANNKKRNRLVILILMMIALVSSGILSISKSFILVAGVIFGLWFVDLMFRQGRVSVKISVILTFSIGILFLLSYTVFTDYFDALLDRFSRDSNLSDFTTGRTDLWMAYLRAFDENIVLFLFGRGYNNILINGRASHNTIIQVIYQVGLIGGISLFFWMGFYFKSLLARVRIKITRLVQLFIILIGVFGAWMGLDYLFSDEFFLFPVYACFAIRFIEGHDRDVKT